MNASTTVKSRYQKLADHCGTCPTCKANPTTACPAAHLLRRAWSRARRGATA